MIVGYFLVVTKCAKLARSSRCSFPRIVRQDNSEAAMQCSVCGQDYGLTHVCAGIAPEVPADERAPTPRLRFDPVYYFVEAGRILCWDDAAVRRAARDNNSLLYGFLILAIFPALGRGQGKQPGAVRVS